MKKILIDGRAFHGIVCDVDGTLVRTEDFKQFGLLTAARCFGLNIQASELLPFLGVSRDQWDQLGPKILGEKWAEIKSARDEAFVSFIESTPLPWVAGAPDLLKWLREIKFPRGRYTTTKSRPMGLAISINSRLDLYMPEAYYGDDVPEGKGKPDPYGYNALARKLAVEPQNMIVVEDSPRGAEAGRRSGAFVVVVKGLAKFSDEDRQYGDLFVDDLSVLHALLLEGYCDE